MLYVNIVVTLRSYQRSPYWWQPSSSNFQFHYSTSRRSTWQNKKGNRKNPLLTSDSNWCRAFEFPSCCRTSALMVCCPQSSCQGICYSRESFLERLKSSLCSMYADNIPRFLLTNFVQESGDRGVVGWQPSSVATVSTTTKTVTSISQQRNWRSQLIVVW